MNESEQKNGASFYGAVIITSTEWNEIVYGWFGLASVVLYWCDRVDRKTNIQWFAGSASNWP